MDTTPLQFESGTGILGRFSFFMSRDPLLSRSGSYQGAGSYGLTTTKEPPDCDGVDGINEQDRTKAKSSAVGAEDAAGDSSRHRKGSRSSSRDKRNGIGLATEGDEPGNSGEETINVDGDHSDDNPPDDSP